MEEAHAVSLRSTPSTGTRNLAPYKPPSDTLSFAPRGKTQPLYRPAALRRSSPAPPRGAAAAAAPAAPSAVAHYSQYAQLPSPAMSSPDLAAKTSPAAPAASSSSSSSWLPWSSAHDSSPTTLLATSTPLGTMVPRSQWRSPRSASTGSSAAGARALTILLHTTKPDEEALICSDPTCKERFSLLVRKHHCRRCGEVFCSSHSSRNAALWPNMEDNGSMPVTPGATPRPSPRSSHVDIPSLALAGHTSPGSSAISVASSSGSNSSSHVSPVVQNRALIPYLGHPQLVRVCDSCFFSAPTPPLQTPPLSAGVASFAFASRPVTLRHPRSGQSTPQLSTSPSFSQSPPHQRRSQRSREPSVAPSSRSRQNSANSVPDCSSIGTSSISTAATSLETGGTGGQSAFASLTTTSRRSYSSVAARAVSPSSSLRYNAIVCVPTTSTGPTSLFRPTAEEDEESEHDQNEDDEQSHELDSDEEQALADEEARQRRKLRLRQAGVTTLDDDDDDDDQDEDYSGYNAGEARREVDDQVEVLNNVVNARGPLVKTRFGSVQQGWQNWATF
ncbi:hypothetical protein OIV83_002246 [Microbotryomycetes sp. JL201]|nr:hypothetical protein OIV83_002246 [Microbotryomycetes sp. JL201]